MAEIKSTLELVMEKTRHLKLDNREKTARRRDEFEKKIGGLLLQYADRRVRLDQFEARLEKLRSELGIDDSGALCRQAIARLALNGDNRRWLELLEAFCRIARNDAEGVLQTFQRRLEALRDRLQARLREELAAGHGIHGSAVVPNLARDREWGAARQKIQEAFHSELLKHLPPDLLH